MDEQDAVIRRSVSGSTDALPACPTTPRSDDTLPQALIPSSAVRPRVDPGGSRDTLERLSRFSMLAQLAPVGIVQLAADWSCL